MSKKNVLTRAKKRQASALVQADRIDEALPLYQRICQSDPEDAESSFVLGTIYGRLGRLAEAESALRRTVSLLPDSAEAHLNLGQTLELLGKLGEAEQCYQRSVTLKADLTDAHESLGRLMRLRGDMHAAIPHHQKAVQLNPLLLPAHLSLAEAYSHLHAYDAAVDSISEVLRLDPDNVGAYHRLARVRIGQGLYEDALENIRKVLRLRPDHIDTKTVEAYILENMGDSPGALACLTPVLDHYHSHPEVALVYATLADFTRDYNGAITMLEDLSRTERLPETNRIQIHFALGHLYDKCGDYGSAFRHFQEGNRLSPQTFDAAAWQERISNLIDTFNREDMRRARRADDGSERPVFIVGMPRSGTTLVEQILSMYPEVATAGELPDLDRIAGIFQELLEHTASPHDIAQLDQEQYEGLARRYLDPLAGRYPSALRVTDKMPQNFFHLGLIALLFPKARIIHCERDPLDTCLSCYFQIFTGYHPYAYDLPNLGKYYRQYQRLMGHWREILDIPIFEVKYEDLVHDPENLGRAMVEFCGLTWDKRCLEFHQSTRAVNTASFQQVRRPVYSSSLGRWRHYADYLGPLKQALAGD